MSSSVGTNHGPWVATIVATQRPGDDAIDPDHASSIRSNGVDIHLDGSDYHVTIVVHAADVSDAARQALGRWWHAIETHRLPHWPASSFSIRRRESAGS